MQTVHRNMNDKCHHLLHEKGKAVKSQCIRKERQ